MHSDERTLRELEEKLLDPQFRKSQAVADLIAADFLEFGSSGRSFDKQQVLEFLENETPAASAALRDFRMTALAPGVALVTFTAEQQKSASDAPIVSLRSSIWKQERGAWKLLFHQGTRVS